MFTDARTHAPTPGRPVYYKLTFGSGELKSSFSIRSISFILLKFSGIYSVNHMFKVNIIYLTTLLTSPIVFCHISKMVKAIKLNFSLLVQNLMTQILM